jgi:chromate transport protein ChrA
VAVLGASAPSAVVAVWLLSVYQTAAANVWAAAGMNGVAAAVAGLMVAGAWLLIRPHLRDGNGWRTLLTAGMAFGLSAGLGWPPVPILGAAAALGWIWKEKGR